MSLAKSLSGSGAPLVVVPLVADAGPDATLVIDTPTALAGAASNGVAPYTYLWSVVSKPALGAVAFVSATVANTNVTLSGATGAYVLLLTVSDSAAQTATDDVTLTV